MSGSLIRYNKKTVTVIGDDGARWNISPVFLQAEPMAQAEAAASGAGKARTSSPRPGRNDRCPCGSGRKYKHCCMAIT